MPSTNGAVPAVDANPWPAHWTAHGRATRGENAHRQVQRTWQGLPISDATFARIVHHVRSALDLSDEAQLLDLGCGNGQLTRPLAIGCHSVTAVDISRDLLEAWPADVAPHVVRVQGDLREQPWTGTRYSHILGYAVLQYFSPGECIQLLRNLHAAAAPHARLFLGDLPDTRRQWAFFNTPDRRRDYFLGLAEGQPIVGTWFDPNWLTHALSATGWNVRWCRDQPDELPYAHFRFDCLSERNA